MKNFVSRQLGTFGGDKSIGEPTASIRDLDFFVKSSFVPEEIQYIYRHKELS